MAKKRASFNLNEDMLIELRDAVAYVQMSGDHTTTLSGLVSSALTAKLRSLRKRHNVGKQFPARGKQELRVGRPIKE
jgi:hypothetical protein